MKINKYGKLEVKRKGQYSCVICPHAIAYTEHESRNTNRVMNEHRSCGDWCALFGEPFLKEITELGTRDYIVISLCKKDWIIPAEEFIDERGK